VCLVIVGVPGHLVSGSWFFFSWLGMQIVNQNAMLFGEPQIERVNILRTAIMDLNCSL
jgi:hypothetical protein